MKSGIFIKKVQKAYFNELEAEMKKITVGNKIEQLDLKGGFKL